MKTDVITVKRNTPVYEAIELLSKNLITGLPVVNDDMTLAGIITEKDVLTLLYTMNTDAIVEDYMTKDVVSFDTEDSIIDITDCFVKNHFRRVPILKDKKVVGIVSKKDVISYILEIKKVGGLEIALQNIHHERKW